MSNSILCKYVPTSDKKYRFGVSKYRIYCSIGHTYIVHTYVCIYLRVLCASSVTVCCSCSRIETTTDMYVCAGIHTYIHNMYVHTYVYCSVSTALSLIHILRLPFVPEWLLLICVLGTSQGNIVWL